MVTQKKITKNILFEKAAGLGMTGVKSLKKVDLIHAIQTQEGHSPCFMRIPDCAVEPCLYRGECQR